MKTAKEVTADLRKNRWSNDTLSPLSTKEYFKLCDKLIDDDEVAFSALMGQSFSRTFDQQKNMIIATDKRIAIARKNGGVRYKNRYLEYADIQNLKVSQDYYMPSRIYATFKYQGKYFGLFSGVKSATFEVMDPTSALHFKRYLDQKIKKEQKLESKSD